jgi:glutathione peroxidase-family protein
MWVFSSSFFEQEPGTNEEIKKFATERYGAKFDLYSKIEVNGNNAHPLYKYLKSKQGGTLGE